MSKVYRVWAKSISYCYIDIEAEDIDHAIDFARHEADGGEFRTTPEGDWEILGQDFVSVDPADGEADYVLDSEGHEKE